MKGKRFIIIKISCKYRDSVEKKYQVKREIHHTQNIKETKRFVSYNISNIKKDSQKLIYHSKRKIQYVKNIRFL